MFYYGFRSDIFCFVICNMCLCLLVYTVYTLYLYCVRVFNKKFTSIVISFSFHVLHFHSNLGREWKQHRSRDDFVAQKSLGAYKKKNLFFWLIRDKHLPVYKIRTRNVFSKYGWKSWIRICWRFTIPFP